MKIIKILGLLLILCAVCVLFTFFDKQTIINGVVLIAAIVLTVYCELKKNFGTNQTPRTNKTSETKKTERYYCKWCGYDYSSIRLLTNNRCNKNPNGEYHEPER